MFGIPLSLHQSKNVCCLEQCVLKKIVSWKEWVGGQCKLTGLVNLCTHHLDVETPEIVLKFLSMIGMEEYTCDVDTSVKFAAKPHRLGKTHTYLDDV